jgi:outer membrane lipoprotein-sorting protein
MMKKMRRSVFLIIACLSFHGSAVADTKLSDILAGIRGTYGDLKGLSLEYRREVITRTMSMLGKKASGDQASGHIYFKPPHFLRLEQEKPAAETLITDGNSLWWYIPRKQKAYRYAASEFGRELKLLSDIFRGLAKIEDNFQVVLENTDDQKRYHIELIPDPPWQEVDRIRLTVTPAYEIAEVRIYNMMGGMTVFHLKNLKEKTAFPDGFFKLDLPEGVKMIDESGTQ